MAIDQLDYTDSGHHATHLLGDDLTSDAWGRQPITVTQDFGEYNPATASMYGYAADQGWPAGTHVGIDIGVSEGTPIYAAEDGTVTESHKDGSIAAYFRPRPVEITTSRGYLDIYGHLGKDAVDVGQQVHKGQLVGWSDQQTIAGTLTPDGTGAHLHFERRDPNGQAINPVPTLLGNVNPRELIGPGSVTGPIVGAVGGATGAVADTASAVVDALVSPIVAFAPRAGLFLLGGLLLAGGVGLMFHKQIGQAAKIAAVA